MSLLRRIAALPLALVLLWTLAFAPYAVARCEHACGATRWHAIGASCPDDAGCADGCCDHDRPEKSRNHDGSECKSFKADDATAGETSPVKIKAPLPADLPPFDFVRVVLVRPVDASGFLANPTHAPPAVPPRETHGRGALPLLT